VGTARRYQGLDFFFVDTFSSTLAPFDRSSRILGLLVIFFGFCLYLAAMTTPRTYSPSLTSEKLTGCRFFPYPVRNYILFFYLPDLGLLFFFIHLSCSPHPFVPLVSKFWLSFTLLKDFFCASKIIIVTPTTLSHGLLFSCGPCPVRLLTVK
jgi:hypothetical protein